MKYVFALAAIGLLLLGAVFGSVVAQTGQRTTNQATVTIRAPGGEPLPFTDIFITPDQVTMDVGDVVTFVATATTADGVLVDVTADLVWESSDETLFIIVGGVGTALAPGEVIVDGFLP